MRPTNIIGALAGALLLLTASPATAKPLIHEHVQEAVVEPIPDLCGVAATYTNELTVHEKISLRHGVTYFAANIHGTESYTNDATGKSLTHVFQTNIHDHVITDNGDGTFTILVHDAGNFQVFGPDGTRLFQNTGSFTFEILVAHGGTPADPSDDEFLEFVRVVKDRTGLDDTGDRDFCEDFLFFTS
jgi:hypothetical protein